MKTRTPLLLLSVLGFLAAPAHAALLWTVGTDDNAWPTTGTGGGANTNFLQENGANNSLPGNKAASDNDYYFAGTYSTPLIPSVVAAYGSYTPVGSQAVNEASTERAYAGGDTIMRFHFNVPATYTPNDRVTVSFDALNLDTGGGADPRWGVEIYINGILVRPEEIIRPAQFDVDYASPPKKLSEVGIVTGAGADNIVTLKGVSYNSAGGGNWMGIDYVKMDIDNSPLLVNTFTTSDALLRTGESATLAWNLAEPTAAVSINQGIGNVTPLTVAGSGSIAVNPLANTTYTLTATLGAQTQTKTVTVNVTTWSGIFEAGIDDGSNAEFSHEDAADDNYYFAGDYTSAGGPNQVANEVLNDDADTNTVPGRTGNPALGFERALTELDSVGHIWFVPSSPMVTPEARIRITAEVLSASGNNALEFSMNGNVLKTQTSIVGPTLVQFEVTGITSTMVAGPNKLTIRRVAIPGSTTVGGNVTFDYVMLEHLPGTLPTITGITSDSILGTRTVNWTSTVGKTYRVQKSADSGVSWIELVPGFPTGGAAGTSLFHEDRVTPWTDPTPTYRILQE